MNKIKYSIIIPICNRNFGLSCCLTCLTMQTFPRSQFEVIIADDGSHEDTLKIVRQFASSLNMKYFWHKDVGFTAAAVRNRGVDLMNRQSDTILFLDSEIIFRKNWLSEYNRFHEEFPDCVICGRYDFLYPLNFTVEDIIKNFDDIVTQRIGVAFIPPDGEPVWPDIRQSVWSEKPRKGGGAMLGGNLLMPKKIFLEAGGFDEEFIGHGGEDCDLGKTITELGYMMVFSPKMMGWHLYHPRNMRRNMVELRQNIARIGKKHKK